MKRWLFILLVCIFPLYLHAQYEHNGFEPQLRVSFDEGVDSYKNFSFGLDFLGAYRFNEFVRLGAGVGINYVNLFYEKPTIVGGHYYNKAMTIPIFINVKVDFIKTKLSPYLGMDAGYNIFIPFSKYAQDNKLGFYFRPAFGVDIHFSKGTLFIELAYKYQMRTFDKWTNPNGNYSQITQAIGFQF